MWEKWKKRIENFIWEEEEDKPKQQSYERVDSHQQIKARMLYQYPDNNNFRFPEMQSPNQKQISNDEYDVPAFHRRKMRTEYTYQQKQKEEPIDMNYTPNTYEQKVEKKPFKPSEVPSPIYGFRSRNQEDNEIEDEPAFLRKPTRLNRSSESIHKEEQEENYLNNEDEITIDNQVVNNENTDEVAVTVEDVQHQTFAEPSEPRPREDKQESIQQRKIISQQKSDNEHNGHKKSRNRSIPYNVMMTPRDKRNMLLQKKKIEEKETKIPVIEASQSEIPLHLLNDPVKNNSTNHLWVREQQRLLEETLKHFNVRAKVVRATQGPAVTRFEVHPELGVKVSKVKNLSDDIKLNMAARDIRIEAPIPGKNTIGIEVPNETSKMVGLQEILEVTDFQESKSPLSIALGLSIEGAPMITNIQKMPHGLIAGATGSGKSVCINTILISLIYKASYEDVKFMLIDPKMVELAPYNGIPHLVSPVITDVKAATAALKWAVEEMEDRYNRFVREGVRDIERYNRKVKSEERHSEKMPYLVIVIDELADLMMVSPQDVEDSISRIAQKARACGIHLLLATQRPSVDVLTGLIKANIPTRIAFSVSSQVDSRTIIDTSGAEKLLGKGDMLFIENGSGKAVRLQGPFVSDEEVERVTNHVRNIAEPNYLFEQDTLLEQMAVDEDEDDLLNDAIQFVLQQNSASTSLLQRHFKIGYNRAARLIDTLEHRGIITGQNGSKPRDILVTRSQLEEL
ncbi:DNA translocase FtsK [Ornithinibacillus halophilus]|uniref:DNA segregation ATPase FtsK/SpoIIIE, S-DNA-T family n=1 Tax=Ornithinibacillus halophilus TaxID=930117 RepID=A0A1M5ELN5_9BACI|nr:DNA translocase FtsK [Ornithinibacillus halophilus]SHF80096.1 DNA segregation ATPase FtsK/SpoIIIE, S-DNA-T family [Ornithinibacillus halophilus]